MPRVIEAASEETIELAELIDMLESGRFDPEDEENFASFAPALGKLANNRNFLADLMIEELKQRCEDQIRGNQYGAQVILLHGPSKDCYVRANIWPAMTDSVIRHSGPDPFFYGIPHDHNFSFLTVGYLGPGYWSEYYEYDYDRVVGYPGEKVDLRFVEKARLDRGKIMLYRAHRDVHLQLAADSLSVSLNIVEASPSTAFRDQYRFDVERGLIAGIMTRMSIEPMLALAAHFGGGEGIDLLDSFAAGHPSDRIRFQALRARAVAEPDLDARAAILERATHDGSRFISAMAAIEAGKLEKTRDWIAAGPPQPSA